MTTSFTKQGIKDVAEKYNDGESLKHIQSDNFNLASERMGLEVIHVSELDTQECKKKMK